MVRGAETSLPREVYEASNLGHARFEPIVNASVVAIVVVGSVIEAGLASAGVF